MTLAGSSVCKARCFYKRIVQGRTRAEGREGTNRDANRVGGGNAYGHGNGDGDGDRAGRGIVVETGKVTQDGDRNGDGSGNGNEGSSEDGNGDENGNGDRSADENGNESREWGSGKESSGIRRAVASCGRQEPRDGKRRLGPGRVERERRSPQNTEK